MVVASVTALVAARRAIIQYALVAERSCCCGQPVHFWVFVALILGRLGRRQPPRHRPVDRGHAARARGAPRPGQRDGRHGHGRVVHDHVGAQRTGGRPAGHGLGARHRGRRSPRGARAPAHHSVPRPNPRRRADERAAAAVDFRGALKDHRGVPGLFGLVVLRRLQQPAGRRVHVADGRLRPVAGVGRDLGHPVRRHQLRLHRRRAVRRQAGPRLHGRCGSS